MYRVLVLVLGINLPMLHFLTDAILNVYGLSIFVEIFFKIKIYKKKMLLHSCGYFENFGLNFNRHALYSFRKIFISFSRGIIFFVSSNLCSV